jgi:hypothetical protein
MRTPLVYLALVPMLALAACDSSPPPAQTSKPAVTAPATPAAKPAATPTAKPAAASLPAAARPMLGTWSEALENCGDAATVSITATTYTSPARTCPMTLKADGDGFALDCGGTALTLVPVFAPSGEGIRQSVAGGKATTLLRCSR